MSKTYNRPGVDCVGLDLRSIHRKKGSAQRYCECAECARLPSEQLTGNIMCLERCSIRRLECAENQKRGPLTIADEYVRSRSTDMELPQLSPVPESFDPG